MKKIPTLLLLTALVTLSFLSCEKTKTATIEKIIHDTVLLKDTLFLHDTISNNDTLFLIDSIIFQDTLVLTQLEKNAPINYKKTHIFN